MSLDVCDSGHQEISYNMGGMLSDHRTCPLCKSINKIEVLEKEVDDLTDKLGSIGDWG